MGTTAANDAVRVAAGGDDMLSKWQFDEIGMKHRRERGVCSLVILLRV